jgi:hypothetical protein
MTPTSACSPIGAPWSVPSHRASGEALRGSSGRGRLGSYAALQLCSSAIVSSLAGVGAWRSGKPDGARLLGMTMIRRGPSHFRARIGTFQRVAAPFPGGAPGRSTRTPPLDRSTAGVARPIFANFAAIHRPRAPMGGMAFEIGQRGLVFRTVRTNIEQTCCLGKELSVRKSRRSRRRRAGRPVLSAGRSQ